MAYSKYVFDYSGYDGFFPKIREKFRKDVRDFLNKHKITLKDYCYIVGLSHRRFQSFMNNRFDLTLTEMDFCYWAMEKFKYKIIVRDKLALRENFLKRIKYDKNHNKGKAK